MNNIYYSFVPEIYKQREVDSLFISPIFHQFEGNSANHEICFQCEPDLPYSFITTNPYLWNELVYTIFFLIVITFIRLRGKNLFDHIAQLFLKRKKINLILNEGITSNITCYLLALSASFSILAGFYSILMNENFITLQTLYCFGALLLFHFFWISLIQLFGWCFNRKQTAQEVIIHFWSYHISLGLLLSPFVLASFYISHFAVTILIKIVIIGFVLLTIVKFLRWIEIFYAHKVSIFYMILYLCGLEIVPLLFLYKVVL